MTSLSSAKPSWKAGGGLSAPKRRRYSSASAGTAISRLETGSVSALPASRIGGNTLAKNRAMRRCASTSRSPYRTQYGSFRCSTRLAWHRFLASSHTLLCIVCYNCGKPMAEQNRPFILQYVQPALLGLMDGSVSTLAPLFAVAFATGSPYVTFLVGLSAAVGAAISMAFAEALSDTGVHTGRGHPLRRGIVTGLATVVGGILHTLPFLIPHLATALALAYFVVAIELVAIAYIRYRYFKTSFWLSVVQVVLGGVLVFLAGLFIGSA